MGTCAESGMHLKLVLGSKAPRTRIRLILLQIILIYHRCTRAALYHRVGSDMNTNAIKTKYRSGFLLAALSIFLAMPAAQAATDGTLILMTSRGARLNEVKRLLERNKCQLLRTVELRRTRQYVMKVRPTDGNIDFAKNKLIAALDSNLSSIESGFTSKLDGDCAAPNDEFFSYQWNLSNLKFPDALCKIKKERHPQRIFSRVTAIDSGVTSISDNREMVFIQQFNMVGGAGNREQPFDSGTHGTGVTGIMAATTNNKTKIAGIASTFKVPTFVTMLRVSNDGVSVDTMDVIDSVCWTIDHQWLRGGPGPVNVSINSEAPNTYNASPVFQSLAKIMREQGDLFVNGSGNNGVEDPSPEKYIRRVTAVDQANIRPSWAVYGPFKAASPGLSVLTFFDSTNLAFQSGTSFSCPHWAGSIALLQSLRPRMRATRADRLLFSSATHTEEDLRIPNLKRAVNRIVDNHEHDWDDCD